MLVILSRRMDSLTALENIMIVPGISTDGVELGVLGYWSVGVPRSAKETLFYRRPRESQSHAHITSHMTKESASSVAKNLDESSKPSGKPHDKQS